MSKGPSLIGERELESLAVVANSAMNRERGLRGVNSYARELGIDPLEALSSVLEANKRAEWLDLCCGTGRALAEAVRRVQGGSAANRLAVIGVDLVDHFAPDAQGVDGLDLVCRSVMQWQPADRFDLITCVHGMHYLGDKLGLLQRAADWLKPGGLLIANFDAATVRATGGGSSRGVAKALRASGFEYDARQRRLSLRGRHEVDLPFSFVGADPEAGPNYTGQPGVDSYYSPAIGPSCGGRVPA